MAPIKSHNRRRKNCSKPRSLCPPLLPRCPLLGLHSCGKFRLVHCVRILCLYIHKASNGQCGIHLQAITWLSINLQHVKIVPANLHSTHTHTSAHGGGRLLMMTLKVRTNEARIACRMMLSEKHKQTQTHTHSHIARGM